MSKHISVFVPFFLLAFAAHPNFAMAQNASREIGLRVSSFNFTQLNPSFIYKKQIAENKYRRYNFGVANVGFSKTGDVNDANLSVNVSVGIENRRSLGKNISFIHGWQRLASVGFSYSENTAALEPQNQLGLSASVGLGYLLGIQYDLSASWYINAEIMPSASVAYTFSHNKTSSVAATSVSSFSVNANASNFISANAAYRF